MTYQRKTRDVFLIQQHTAEGWEDVSAGETRAEAKSLLRDYRVNQPEIDVRMVKRRERIEP